MANQGVINTENSSLAFMNDLAQEQNSAFQGQQTALNAVQGAWSGIMNGTSAPPQGYSPALDSLLKSQIISTGATSTANQMDAAALRQKQESGGANVLPQGATDAINAQIEATGQQNTAKNLQAEKTADFQQGLSNLEGGTQAELGVANGENEVGLAKDATGAGSLGLSAAQLRNTEDQQSGPAAILGDIGAGVKDAAGIAGIASGFMGLGGSTGGVTAAQAAAANNTPAIIPQQNYQQPTAPY